MSIVAQSGTYLQYLTSTSICYAQFQEASDSTPSTVTTASRFVACYSQHFNQRPSWVQSGQSFSFHHHIAKHFMTKCITPMFAKSAASACVCASVCVCVKAVYSPSERHASYRQHHATSLKTAVQAQDLKNV